MNFGSEFVLDQDEGEGEVIDDSTLLVNPLLAAPVVASSTPPPQPPSAGFFRLPAAPPGLAAPAPLAGAAAAPQCQALLAAAGIAGPPLPLPLPRGRPQPPKSYRRRVDTNIVNIDFASLGQETAVATGDPQLCGGCGACLNAFSRLEPAATEMSAEEGCYRWTCEFCGAANSLVLDEMEKPAAGAKSFDYVLEAPHVASAAGSGAAVAGAGTTIVFCVDTSGSMCSTTAVQGRLSLRGDRTRDLANTLRTAGDAADQRWNRAQQNVTWVSRMQSVQAAVDAELERLAKEQPAARVGLVTFAGDVVLLGDTSNEPRTLAGDRLNDLNALTEAGAGYALTKPISEARNALSERLFALEESGPTALGPAVAAALAMVAAAAGGTNGRVIVCTDGLANVGVGALDEEVKEEAQGENEPAALYQQLGAKAAEKGVVIDLITIVSEGCDVESIGALAEASHGTVTSVDPLSLATKYGGILTVPLLATNVSVTMLLHAGLRFRDSTQTQQRKAQTAAANGNGVSAGSGSSGAAGGPTGSGGGAAAALARGNRMEKFVGNVTSETEMSLEFELRPPSERPPTAAAAAAADAADAATANAAAAPAASAPSRLPFQVQIRYTRPDGTRVLRVVSDVREVTRDRFVAERHATISVVASHAMQQSSAVAREGAYLSSRVHMRAWDNLVSRTAMSNNNSDTARREYAAFQSDYRRLDGALSTAQASEMATGGAAAALAASEDADEEAGEGLSRARRTRRSGNDAFSSLTYSLGSKSSKQYRR